MSNRSRNGLRKMPGYNSWATMISRCHNPDSERYPYYGGRGIIVCERWRESFANFLADMGQKPAGKTLDRRDNDGGYTPENCRWATLTEQQNNTRSNVYYVVQGEKQTLAQIVRAFGLPRSSVQYRLSIGMSIERALGLTESET
jgi:hypothetical protein